MIQPMNKTEDLLLLITKNCETIIKQTHRKAEETLEFKMVKPRETFHFKPPIQFQGDWMIGLINLEVYNSIFNLTEENNKFEIYRDTSAKFGFLELKDEIEDILNIPHITNKHLDDEIIGQRIIDEYYKLSTEKMNTDGYMILFLDYSASSFRDFESYLRLVIGLDEEDIRLILKEYISHFITRTNSRNLYNSRYF